ncbi:putative coenzyme A biosynthesis bifunctional protein CoaBC [Halobacteriovorax marinus SJ]|uniref:Coenzyme A biosynthesis bifunctional protein CoaBC n=1 Tax=Halobacteriovorax marinus (strain ATCC BAA-682 / DSM 15412 / SJ) TaxID=862908 RepID=E1X539_HALMS|nr:bifunctional phosphopantothenoylcysteine decarboxylase/phosphopantothenate--cysteine ligase CoaBC [Halobacteriovorax marinus]CBW25510.1 putative coenzyme A biosynthesis bifunctional protein CoaBC [Halobacteriovorax marinus SJ]
MRVLLGVCGSIAAYKTLDLARSLVKAGHEVKVVLTRGAQEFVVPNVYKYLGVSEVFYAGDDFNYPDKTPRSSNVLHIELAKWADKLVIAPLSANTLSTLSRGGANDLLSSIFLAIEQNKQILLFPAMNTNMLNHPFVKENFELVEKIKSLPQVFVATTKEGELACGDVGEGKLSDIEDIHELIETLDFNDNKKKIVITTGATISSVDPVRYLTNASSGKTGFEIAKELLKSGHYVKVIAGKNATGNLDRLSAHPRFSLERVVSTRDMLKSALESTIDADAYISAAAISDIEFIQGESKLKKNQLSNSLEINTAPDVLKNILESRNPKLKVIGFAAETNLSEEILLEKWNRKKVDLLVGTHVSSGLTQKTNTPLGFGVDQAKYSLMKDGQIFFNGELTKKELSTMIAQEIL